MGLTLTAADLARVRRAQDLLLAPLDHASPAAWLESAAFAIRQLIEAGYSTVLSGGSPPDILHSTLPESARIAYASHYAERDIATARALRLGIEVAHLLDVVRPEEYFESELHHDFASPNGLHDAMLIRTEAPPGRSIWVATQQADPLDRDGIARAKALLELALPAFSAGVRACTLGGVAHGLLGALDSLNAPLAVCDADGRWLHETPALARALADDPDAQQVRARMATLAARVARSRLRPRAAVADPDPLVPTAEIASTLRRYRISGTPTEAGPDARLLIFVQLEALTDAPDTPVGQAHAPPRPGAVTDSSRLRLRFGLTPREAEVARLLAQRMTNREIAAELRISEHTAERHTERVLAKLGIDSRTRVRSRLGEASD